MRLLWVWLIAWVPLFAEPMVVATTEGEPSANICDSVNVLTGDFHISQDDLVIPGFEPIRIHRFSSNTYHGNSLFPHLTLQISIGGKTWADIRAIVSEPTGAELRYEYVQPKGHTNFPEYRVTSESVNSGVTNVASGEMSGRTNLKNQTIQYYVASTDPKNQGLCYLIITTANGTKRKYGYKGSNIAYLEEEVLPNGNVVLYSYQNNYLYEVKTQNPSRTITYAWLRQEYKNGFKIITTSDGRQLTYYHSPEWKDQVSSTSIRANNIDLYTEVIKKTKPNKDQSRLLINERTFMGGFSLRPLYQHYGPKDAPHKVCRIDSNAFGENSFYPIYRFEYREGYNRGATVYDALSNPTLFNYDENYRPSLIERQNSKREVLYREHFTWKSARGKGDSELIYKTYQGPKGEIYLTKVFAYDDQCNVKTKSICGDLTGSGYHEGRAINYEYSPWDIRISGNFLTKKTEMNGLVTAYTYWGCSPLVTSKLTIYQDKILQREFHTYNHDGVLIATQSDDGSSSNAADFTDVTSCQMSKITPVSEGYGINLPEKIEQGYLDLEDGRFVVLHTKVVKYNISCQVVEETHYNAEGKKLYTLFTDYDAHGRPVRVTDPMERESFFGYDVAGNKNYEKLHTGVEGHYLYDLGKRLIEEKIVAPDGAIRTQKHRYNAASQRISTVDHHGIETTFTYDALGHLEDTCREGIKTRKVNNWQGKVVAETDPNGAITTRGYTAEGKPKEAVYPDGSKELWRYDIQGNLIRHENQSGTVTTYSYDAQGRLLSYETEGVVHKNEYERGKLKRTIDPAGNARDYFYDKAGRKVAERFLGLVTRYTYDAEGRLSTHETEGRITRKEYDILGQVLSEKTYGKTGKLLRQTRYKYDAAGNKSQTIVPWEEDEIALSGKIYGAPQAWSGRESTTKTLYDAWKRPIKITDAEGKVTTISYDEKALSRTVKEPSGHYKTEQSNSLLRTIRISCHAPSGKEVAREEFSHDNSGNVLTKLSTIYGPDGSTRQVTTRWEYDSLNRPIKLIEADLKITAFSYTPTGKRKTVTKPDGTVLTSTYDKLDREIRLTSSDGTIDYITEYDILSHPIKITDKINKLINERTYDARGNLLSEKLGNGLTISKSYDTQSRVTALNLPDGGSAKYTYDELYLRAIARINASGKQVYQHLYTHYNLAGKLTRQQPLNSDDTTQFTYDVLGRPQLMRCEHLVHELKKFDLRGNLISHNNEGIDYRYTYDDLNQLTSEKSRYSHTYSYDSHNNRLSKDSKPYIVNDLNQVLIAAGTPLTYTENGNPNTIGAIKLKYDALDRLIEYTDGKTTTYYLYDAFHRRLVSTTNNIQTHFLYDDQNEIGAYSKNRQELRILGLGKGAEIGAAIAIEINGRPYMPLHDLLGNTQILYDYYSGHIAESYIYTAFGETIRSGPPFRSAINPWQFASKRTDPTGLIFYGRRYYNPQLGRWLTPDPLGLHDGPNLYAFISNHPLLHLDLYGLYGTSPHNRTVNDYARDSVRRNFPGSTSSDPNHFTNYNPPAHLVSNNSFSRPQKPYGQVAVFNGMNHTDADHKIYKNNLTNRLNWTPDFVHLESGGLLSDLSNYQSNLFGGTNKPNQYMAARRNSMTNKLDSFFEKTVGNADAKILMVLHSQAVGDAGCILPRYSEEQRRKVEIFAMGGDVFLNPKLCGKMTQCIAQGDMIAHIQLTGLSLKEGFLQFEDGEKPFASEYGHAITLPKQPGTPLNAHRIDNPTYLNAATGCIQEFDSRHHCR